MHDNLTRTNLEFAHREAEKRIADLEKENANLKALRKYELNVAKLEIENLEKENAELKEKLKPENCLKLLAKEGYIKFTSDQLTKAKEIIKGLLIILHEIATDEYDFEKTCPYQYKEAKDFLGGE